MLSLNFHIDWKASILLFDLSTQHGDDDFIFTIFRPRDLMPDVGAGDVVYVQSARVCGINVVRLFCDST